MKNPVWQSGVGLMEVMLTLTILVAGALGVAKIQTTTMVATQTSSFHFALDHLASDVIEALRSHRMSLRATGFDYNTTGATLGDASISKDVHEWNRKVKETIPTGQGYVSCTSSFCNVTISWLEEIDDSMHTQYYRVGTPL